MHATRYPRLIGVGLPRTGTRFLAGMLRPPKVARHEYDLNRQAFVATAHLRGDADPQAVRNYLAHRRATIDADADICSANHDVITVWPHSDHIDDAVYVLTIRHPLQWVDAYARAVCMMFGAPSPTTRALRAARCRPDLWPHQPGDEPLAALGLFSLDAYLNWWARATSEALTSIPARQLLIIPTTELPRAGPLLAQATRWSVHDVVPQQAHRHAGPPWATNASVIEAMPRAHVERVCERHLGGLQHLVSELARHDTW